MALIAMKKYEISVWEDKLVTENGETKLRETKLAVIGSDTMTAMNRAYEPVFNKKSNGEKTLTFSLKYKYFDPYTGNNGVVNPFVGLLTNERKVKLYYQDKWYEFIVKDHTESSDEYTWTYTCVDAFVSELSKIGYGIVLDSELGNNQGTARELVDRVIKDTDWRVGTVNAGYQRVAEPIYKAVLRSKTGVNISVIGGTDAVPAINSDIYLFYSYVKERIGNCVQFIIRSDSRNYIIDDNNVITDTNFRITTPLVYRTSGGQTGFWLDLGSDNYRLIIEIVKTGSQLDIENLYQANRIVLKQRTTYDPVMERTVNIYKAGEREYYSYVDSSYVTSDVLTSYVTNGSDFTISGDAVQGWGYYNDATSITKPTISTYFKPQLVTKPVIGSNQTLLKVDENTAINAYATVESYLKIRLNNGVYFPGIASNGKIYNTVYNTGINNNLSMLGTIAKGEKFVFRYRAGTCANEKIANYVPTTALRLIVAKFTTDADGKRHINKSDVVLRFAGSEEGRTGSQQLDNIISGGTFNSNKTEYTIDGVVQAPSPLYKYKYGSNYYVWSSTNKKYVLATNTNYHPYYYLIAEAEKTVTAKQLSNKNYGIFIYSCAHSSYNREIVTDPIDSTYGRYYYIQDIQLTRYIPDGGAAKPVIIGNIPTTTIYDRTYFYAKPKSGAKADEIPLYTSRAALGVSGLTALYNNSTKVLSVSASQSNCFNILQDIAQAFECWIELDVGHDSNGYITYDSSGKPNKFINVKQFIGKDNWAGFKYGINLQSIERDINSEEIVTKLIVDQAQSDLVDSGYVSIGDAPSNPSGESYILNFNYYYSQGLLNKELVEKDKNNFITTIASKNKEIKNKEKQKRNYEASLVALESKKNVYAELIAEAKQEKSEALADFKRETGLSYNDYASKYKNKLAPEHQTTDSNNILDTLGQLYVAQATINNYSGILTNTNSEYTKINHLLHGKDDYTIKIWTEYDNDDQRHIFVELSDFISGVIISVDGITQTSSITDRKFEWTSNTALRVFLTPPTNYKIAGSSTQYEYYINNKKIARLRLTKNETAIRGLVDEIDDLIDEKEEFVREFENKYYRFIQEGTWNSTDYVDSELYYLDAIQISNTSAFPKVSYTINVVEISELNNSASYIYDPEHIKQLTDYKGYIFDAGDKTYVEDTEFFGWNRKDGVLTPAREEVIVSEVEWHLDEPDKNTITVQNYKTRFEDLFQRINATVQTVQYNESTYAKTSTLLDANGTLNQNILLKSMNIMAGKERNLTTDGSVQIMGDNIYIHNLTKPSNYVMINSEGVNISSDGGNNWSNIINGKGVNIGSVYTGSLNTNEVVIGNKDKPTFRWDKTGISAYYTTTTYIPPKYEISQDEEVVEGKIYYTIDEEGNYIVVENPTGDPNENEYYEKIEEAKDDVDVIDLKTFVRFDQFGVYGIKNSPNFVASNIDDIKNNAHFAVTWDGFFIKNSYPGGGRVEITSDNDFRVLNTVSQQENEKVKIGALEWMVPADVNSFSSEKTYYIENEGVYVEVENPTISEIDSYYEKELESQSGIEPSLYGIRIKNDAGATVMQTDDDGNLTITGTINANAGNIGGMTVDDDKLSMDTIVLEPGVGIYSTELVNNQPAFLISDTDGSATFRNINALGGTLGQLTVQNTINVGDNTHAGVIKSYNYLVNQSGWRIDSNGLAEFQSAIVTGEINATSGIFSGNVQVGTSNPYISINGQQALIRSSNYSDGADRGWMINKDGDAVFNNITARGAIKTAVFEYAEIQAVGGIFIFRPSSTIRSAMIGPEKQDPTETKDLILTVDKPQLFKDGQWCKVSNYASGNNDPDVIDPQTQTTLQNNGLTHVYQVSRTQGSNNITLLGAAAMIEGQDAVVEFASDLIGGALVDMGNKEEDPITHKVGTSNYGIGINSSDNTVNLPPRAISLFETVIDETQEPKITYDYQGILGTLPYLSSTKVKDSIYNSYMATHQGIYTNNMYIGNDDQYIAFYEDDNQNKHLKISAQDMIFGYDPDTGSEVTWEDKIVEVAQEAATGSSQIIITLYKLSNDKPNTPSTNITYNINTGKLTGDLEGWTTTIQDSNEISCWSISTTIIKQESLEEESEEQVIYPESWTDPIFFNKNNYIVKQTIEYILSTSKNELITDGIEENEWTEILPEWRIYTYAWYRMCTIYNSNVTDDLYELTMDTEVISGTTYYNRMGEGTIEDPYVYEIVTPEIGDNPKNNHWYICILATNTIYSKPVYYSPWDSYEAITLDTIYTIDNNTATFTVQLFANGINVIDQYEDFRFSWYAKSEDKILGEQKRIFINTGKQININLEDYRYDVTIVCEFNDWIDLVNEEAYGYLTQENGDIIVIAEDIETQNYEYLLDDNKNNLVDNQNNLIIALI